MELIVLEWSTKRIVDQPLNGGIGQKWQEPAQRQYGSWDRAGSSWEVAIVEHTNASTNATNACFQSSPIKEPFTKRACTPATNASLPSSNTVSCQQWKNIKPACVRHMPMTFYKTGQLNPGIHSVESSIPIFPCSKNKNTRAVRKGCHKAWDEEPLGKL